MKTKIVAVALITITVGVFTFTRTKNAPPSDFRDAVAERSPEFNTDISVFKDDNGNLSVPKAGAVDEKTKIATSSLPPLSTPLVVYSDTQIIQPLSGSGFTVKYSKVLDKDEAKAHAEMWLEWLKASKMATKYKLFGTEELGYGFAFALASRGSVFLTCSLNKGLSIFEAGKLAFSTYQSANPGAFGRMEIAVAPVILIENRENKACVLRIAVED